MFPFPGHVHFISSLLDYNICFLCFENNTETNLVFARSYPSKHFRYFNLRPICTYVCTMPKPFFFA